MAADRPRTQLVIQTAFLGDLLLSIPLFQKIRDMHPQDHLALVCRKGLGDFFLRTSLVDEVFEVQKGNQKSYAEIQEKLKNYDLQQIISPHTSLRTAFFVQGLKSPRKISFTKWWNWLTYNDRVPRNPRLPDALRQLSLLAPQDENLAEDLKQYLNSGRAFRRGEDQRLSGVPPWAKMSLRKKLTEDAETWMQLKKRIGWESFAGRPKVLIFPGSVWATKRWTEEGFVQVAQQLQEKGAQILVMGAGNEVEIAERVAKAVPGAISLAGKTSLYESALVMCQASLMIGNDSASIHLASACETPLIAIFGPTVLEFGFRPWSDQAWVVEKQGLACRPCGPHGHHKCPKGTHECMKNLSSAEVLKIARDLV